MLFPWKNRKTNKGNYFLLSLYDDCSLCMTSLSYIFMGGGNTNNYLHAYLRRWALLAYNADKKYGLHNKSGCDQFCLNLLCVNYFL